MIQISCRDDALPRLHSWRSLFRTTRASIGVLLIAAIGLVMPAQTADELVALSEMTVRPIPGVAVPGVVLLQVALLLLSLSAWYWARAALSARFGTNDTLEARPGCEAGDRAAFEAVPRMIFVASALLGGFLLWRGFSWAQAAAVALWAAPAYAFVRWRTPKCARERVRQAQLDTLRSTRNLWAAFGVARRRLRALVLLAPFGPAVSLPLLAVSMLPFVWGVVEGYLNLGPGYPGLPAYAAQVFPGPSVALIGLALIIGPLTALIFAADSLRLEAQLLRRRTGFSRPPVITLLLLWIATAPALFNLHTVRTVRLDRQVIPPAARASLNDFLDAWVTACGQDPRLPLRPIVVSVSGGASRAAIWGAHVLAAVQQAASEVPNTGVFAISSVSGGSLGAGAFMTVVRAAPAPCGKPGAVATTILEGLDSNRLGSDALGPVLAGALLNDVPRAVFSPIAALVRGAIGEMPRGGDRAEALERAFEHLWHEDLLHRRDSTPVPEFSEPYLSLFYRADHSIRPGMPVWITNGTDVTTGERVLTEPFGSQVDLHMAWPFRAATDAIGQLDRDVPISTAINNSARFAYLEPAGALVSVVSHARQMRSSTPELVDGGYFDNEGLQTAYELALWLQTQRPHGRVVDPILVQATANADLGLAAKERIVRCPDVPVDLPTTAGAGPRPLEVLAPLLGLYNVRQAHTAVLLREVRDRFCGTGDTGRRFFHFYLFQADGQDIPLNWLLSPASIKAIQRQLPLHVVPGVPDEGGNTVELAGLNAALRAPAVTADTAAAQ